MISSTVFTISKKKKENQTCLRTLSLRDFHFNSWRYFVKICKVFARNWSLSKKIMYYYDISRSVNRSDKDLSRFLLLLLWKILATTVKNILSREFKNGFVKFVLLEGHL